MKWEAKKVNPGPGETCYYAIMGEIPGTPRTGVIADTFNSDYMLTIEEEGKYACLLATAPELLKECEAFSKMAHLAWTDPATVQDIFKEIERRALAVIAKVKGSA